MRSFLCFISFLAFFSPLAWATFADANEAYRSPSPEAREVASPPLQVPPSKAKVKVMVAIYSIEIDTTFLGVAAEGNRNAENQIESGLLEMGLK